MREHQSIATPESDTSFTKAFAQRLSERAKSLGVSQADICRATGCARSSVSVWFSGQTVPRLDSIPQLCKLLKCSSDWLIKGEGALYDSDTSLSGSVFTAGAVPESNPEFSILTLPKVLIKGIGDIEFVRWVEVDSESCSPVISKGDIVLLDTRPSSELEDGKYYAFRFPPYHKVSVYRVKWEVDGIYLLSHNEDAKAVKLDALHYAKPIGLVIGRMGQL
jgi:transcriptional regulator with XRE-family HTH domain